MNGHRELALGTVTRNHLVYVHGCPFLVCFRVGETTMREWLIFLALLGLLVDAMTLFAFGLRDGIREARGAKEEMHEIRLQLENLNTYMEKISR
jgi:hypothetical protein